MGAHGPYPFEVPAPGECSFTVWEERFWFFFKRTRFYALETPANGGESLITHGCGARQFSEQLRRLVCTYPIRER